MSDSDTSQRGIVHATWIAAVLSAASWAYISNSDDDNELLASIASSVFGGWSTTKVTYGLRTQDWGFAPIDVWAEMMEHFRNVMDGYHRGC